VFRNLIAVFVAAFEFFLQVPSLPHSAARRLRLVGCLA
jgi:hypothetical protein